MPLCKALVAVVLGVVPSCTAKFHFWGRSIASSLTLTFSWLRVSHSQTLTTCQPAVRKALAFERSRSTLPRRFAAQNVAFVAGATLPYRQE